MEIDFAFPGLSFKNEYRRRRGRGCQLFFLASEKSFFFRGSLLDRLMFVVCRSTLVSTFTAMSTNVLTSVGKGLSEARRRR